MVAQMPAFWSATPRPQMVPSMTCAPNGSARSVRAQCRRQSSTATVSRCPASTSDRPPSGAPANPYTFGLPGATSARRTSSQPPAESRPATQPANSDSSPVTLGIRTASRTNSTSDSGSTAAAAAPATAATSARGARAAVPPVAVPAAALAPVPPAAVTSAATRAPVELLTPALPAPGAAARRPAPVSPECPAARAAPLRRHPGTWRAARGWRRPAPGAAPAGC